MYPEFPYLGYKEQMTKVPVTFPAQHQNVQPGIENQMTPLPIFEDAHMPTGNKLKNKVAIISGGDSGIGRAVAVLFAKQGANLVLSYLNEKEDALFTKQKVESYGSKCILIEGDLRDENFCKSIASKTIEQFGKIDILVNNCGVQFPQNSILDITAEQLKDTFETNFYTYFYLTKAVLPYLKPHSCIINTSSINSFKGNAKLIDYSATKGAITSFTKSMAQSLAPMKIRVNEVAPGPIWTPLIVSSFNAEEVTTFGSDVPLKRAGQPFEVAPAYLYLASDDSYYVTGQTLHVNGGTII